MALLEQGVFVSSLRSCSIKLKVGLFMKNKKPLITLLIVLCSLLIASCTPKKSEAELAAESRIAALEKQLAELSGGGAENATKAAELQAELQTAQAGLETAQVSREQQGGNQRQSAAQPQAPTTAAVSQLLVAGADPQAILQQLKVQRYTSPNGCGTAISTITARKGEQAVVTFNLNHPGLAGLQLSVGYDKSRLRLDSIARGKEGLRFITYTVGSRDNNPFTALWYSASNDTSRGEILSLSFTVLPDAAPGDASVDVRNYVAVNSRNDKIPLWDIWGGVTVLE
jgi:hypothetical protein